MNLIKIILGIFFLACVSCEYKSFKNYKVYNVLPKSEEHLQILTDLKKDISLDFWSDIVNVGTAIRIMVSPEKQDEFVSYMTEVGMKPEIKMDDVQKFIELQMKPGNSTSGTRSAGSFTWDVFHPLEEINNWLDELVDLYPNIVSIVTIGQSYEGRPIRGVEINYRHEPSPIIGMIEGGIHSREWVSPASATWIISEFLSSTNPEVRALAENIVWNIFPVVNPDGYVYTFTNNRMWRKSRNPTNHVPCGNDNDFGNGIDLNRNFDFVWMSIGASNNPCTETYAGPSAFSEPESRAISEHVRHLQSQGQLLYYLSFHTFSQLLLIPYSHVEGVDVLEVDNYADLYEIGVRGMDKLQEKYGTEYIVGPSRVILYAVSGSSFDWVKGVANVPIVFLFELRDNGQYGFLLPPELMRENNLELVDGLLEMDRNVRELGYYVQKDSATSIVLSTALLLFSLFSAKLL